MAHSDKPAPKRRRKSTHSAPEPPPAGPALLAEPAFAPDRREKIARLKKAIDDGTYHVSSDEVARKVIEHMLQPKK